MELEDSFNSSDLDNNVLHIEQIKVYAENIKRFRRPQERDYILRKDIISYLNNDMLYVEQTKVERSMSWPEVVGDKSSVVEHLHCIFILFSRNQNVKYVTWMLLVQNWLGLPTENQLLLHQHHILSSIALLSIKTICLFPLNL